MIALPSEGVVSDVAALGHLAQGQRGAIVGGDRGIGGPVRDVGDDDGADPVLGPDQVALDAGGVQIDAGLHGQGRADLAGSVQRRIRDPFDALYRAGRGDQTEVFAARHPQRDLPPVRQFEDDLLHHETSMSLTRIAWVVGRLFYPYAVVRPDPRLASSCTTSAYSDVAWPSRRQSQEMSALAPSDMTERRMSDQTPIRPPDTAVDCTRSRC